MQLHIHRRKGPAPVAFDARPGAMREWVDELPVANIGETSRRIYGALVVLNTQELDAGQRFEALELLRPTVFYVLEAMKKHFIGQSFPMPEKAQKVARLSQELLRELGDGYKLLIMEQARDDASRRSRHLATWLHRALRCLGHQLLKSYQIYAPCPRGVWADLHQIYRYGERHKLQGMRIDDPYNLVPGNISLADAYKQLLLLALACPYRMRHGEVAQVYARLEHWATHSKLTTMANGPASALFVVHLSQDDPPTYRMLHDSAAADSDCRLLDTAGLADDVRAALSECQAQSGGRALNERALKRLMLSWGVMPKRRFSRTQNDAKVSVAMGLSATHYFVSGESVFNPGGDRGEPMGDNHHARSHFSAAPIGSEQGRTPELWELEPAAARETGQSIRSAPRTAPIPDLQLPEPRGLQAAYHFHEWHMVNVSAGGYCLLWENTEAARAQVGELVGIQEHDDPDSFHWRLGVIRWLKASQGLELGVQMLSPGAIAVGARPYPARTPGQQFMRGLLLPEIPSIGQPATLILPSPPFRAGDTALVNSNGRELKTRLTKVVENTGAFAQFHFAPFQDRQGGPGPSDELSGADESDFEELWDSI
jgi:hypothetical protein